MTVCGPGPKVQEDGAGTAVCTSEVTTPRQAPRRRLTSHNRCSETQLRKRPTSYNKGSETPHHSIRRALISLLGGAQGVVCTSDVTIPSRGKKALHVVQRMLRDEIRPHLKTDARGRRITILAERPYHSARRRLGRRMYAPVGHLQLGVHYRIAAHRGRRGELRHWLKLGRHHRRRQRQGAHRQRRGVCGS